MLLGARSARRRVCARRPASRDHVRDRRRARSCARRRPVLAIASSRRPRCDVSDRVAASREWRPEVSGPPSIEAGCGPASSRRASTSPPGAREAVADSSSPGRRAQRVGSVDQLGARAAPPRRSSARGGLALEAALAVSQPSSSISARRVARLRSSAPCSPASVERDAGRREHRARRTRRRLVAGKVGRHRRGGGRPEARRPPVSIAEMQTSPSPWAKCRSPTDSSPPGTCTGSHSRRPGRGRGCRCCRRSRAAGSVRRPSAARGGQASSGVGRVARRREPPRAPRARSNSSREGATPIDAGVRPRRRPPRRAACSERAWEPSSSQRGEERSLEQVAEEARARPDRGPAEVVGLVGEHLELEHGRRARPATPSGRSALVRPRRRAEQGSLVACLRR